MSVAEAAPIATVGDRHLTFPVEVRRATTWAAHFLVPASAAREVTAAARLDPAEPLPRRGLLTLAFVRYEDTDLGPYHELAMTLMVRTPGLPRPGAAGLALEAALGAVGTYVHRLPVDREFSMLAGRELWGFPKTLASIRIETRGGAARCTLSEGGHHELTLTVHERRRVRMPMPSPPNYTWSGGVLRETDWDTEGTAVRGGPGGAAVELGTGPMADDLRRLGLPRRALMSTVADVRARFGPARVVA